MPTAIERITALEIELKQLKAKLDFTQEAFIDEKLAEMEEGIHARINEEAYQVYADELREFRTAIQDLVAEQINARLVAEPEAAVPEVAPTPADHFPANDQFNVALRRMRDDMARLPGQRVEWIQANPPQININEGDR
jgi:hypothetical protein